MFYHNGVNFALRSGKKHRQLRHEDCQIEVVEKIGERAYLQYIEDVSKNNQGGLKGRKKRSKEVLQHSNENVSRRPVRLFKLYNSLCPKDRPPNAFYLQALRNPTKDCWFSVLPLGHNALENMVKKMCKRAGIDGFKTNHSLRATAATRLFQAGVDEQLIMERTAHRSVDGVWSYKRTNQEQRLSLSDVMNLSTLESKRQHLMGSGQQQMVSIQGCYNFTINVNINKP